LTIETHDLGKLIAERYKLSVYDAMIVAAALLGGCDTLYSEDMQDGLLIDNQLRICNPFTIHRSSED
jgi:predicted nucleic acid-binding protein